MILEDGKYLYMSKEEVIKLATRILQAVGEIEGGKEVSTSKRCLPDEGYEDVLCV